MADISDVCTGLGQLAGTILYPSGATGEQPSPVVGAPVLIQVGWPSPESLDQALAAGKVMVTLYPRQTERNVTRYPRRWQTQTARPHTYSLTVSGLVLTVGGSAPSPFYAHNLAVLINGRPYVYQTQTGQAASDVATAMGAFLGEYFDVTVSGDAITFNDPTVRIGYVRVGTGAATQREVRRQQRDIQITVWASSPALRDQLAAPIDAVLAVTDFMTLADGSSCRLLYKSSPETDFDQKQGIYRRDLIYSAEYATLQSQTAYEIVVADLNLYDQFGDLMYTNDPAAPVFSNSLNLSDARNSFEIPNI